MPIIEGAFAVLECKTFQTVEAGDHTILIGEVTNIQIEKNDPMLYHRRHFASIPAEFYELSKKLILINSILSTALEIPLGVSKAFFVYSFK